MKPVEGSPITERSGTRRMVWLDVMPGAFCHEGRDHSAEAPPPPALIPSFHPLWARGLMLETLSPPTAVTKGWEAGSSTAGLLLVMPLQSEQPESPAAATTVWPWAAICSKIGCSAAGSLDGSDSHVPHDVVTTVAVLSSAMRVKTSVGPELLLGPV